MDPVINDFQIYSSLARFSWRLTQNCSLLLLQNGCLSGVYYSIEQRVGSDYFIRVWLQVRSSLILILCHARPVQTPLSREVLLNSLYAKEFPDLLWSRWGVCFIPLETLSAHIHEANRTSLIISFQVTSFFWFLMILTREMLKSTS